MTSLSHAEGAARDRAAASLPPLSLIAFSFFLPFVAECGQTIDSPRHFIAQYPQPLFAAWVAPAFIGAALLALGTALVLLRPALIVYWPVAAIATALSLAGNLVWLGCAAAEALRTRLPGTRWERCYSLWSIAAIVIGSALCTEALRCRGFVRWSRLIASYAVFASPHCYMLIDAGRAAIGLGGWCYASADFVLIALPLCWPLFPRKQR